MDNTPRSEDEIFSELEQLCASVGYIHVFAALVVQNTYVAFAEGIKGEDFHKTFEKDHLVVDGAMYFVWANGQASD